MRTVTVLLGSYTGRKAQVLSTDRDGVLELLFADGDINYFDKHEAR